MASIHRLEQVIAALVTDFAHDDAVGAVPQCSGYKLARRDGNLTGNRIHRLPTNGIGMGYLQFGGLFNYHEPFMQRNVVQ